LAESGSTVTVTDSLDRTVVLPATVTRIICSGPGCLRYLTYLQCQNAVVAVDDMEKRRPAFDARPYAFAHPEYQDLPLFGEFRGYDNPELILALDPAPQVIFKTYPETGFNPDELQEKTGLPVVTLAYGDLGENRETFYATLRLIGRVMGKETRAEEVIAFIDDRIADLDRRTKDITDPKPCYIGGVAYRGPLGLTSTEPGYSPFTFIHAQNVAAEGAGEQAFHLTASAEKLVEWNPEYIFIDLATYQTPGKGNAAHELVTRPAFKNLRALTSGNVYLVLPYNWYTQNHGSTLANAYYIGTVLYPDRFKGLDPAATADEIYTFLVGKPVFALLNESFGGLAFRRYAER